MAQLPILYGPEEITPDWLTQALRSTGAIGGCEVLDLKVEPFGEGRGVWGNIARLIPRYSNQDVHNPRTLIAKFPSSDPNTRANAGSIGLNEREHKFYTELAVEVNLRTPRNYYSNLSPDNADLVILMEDLSHGRAGNSVEGCSEVEAEQAIYQLAQFHAQWWNSAFLEKSSWVPIIGAFLPAFFAVYNYKTVCNTFLERFESSIPSEIAEAAPELDQLPRTSSTRLSGPPFTMLHGDYHLDNLIFDLPGNDPTIAVIDWQIVSKGLGVVDVVTFLTSYGDTNRRRETESKILNLYHSTLLECGVKDYGFDQCLSDYCFAVAWRFVKLMAAMGLPDAAPPKRRMILDRTCNSIVEWNVLEELRS